MHRSMLPIVAAVTMLAGREGHATLVTLGPGSFTQRAPVITFDEVPLGTTNPSITLPSVPALGDVTVRFAGAFVGQSVGGGFPVTLVDTTPTPPLTLDVHSPQTEVVDDDAPGATSPVLSGAPTFNGPIAILFSIPVAGVGIRGGFFDATDSVTIEAYDVHGESLGTVTNLLNGFEFYGLADLSGATVIRGVSVYSTGTEPAGFEIDDVTFGAANVIVGLQPTVPSPVIPSPLSVAGALLTALLLVAGYRRIGARQHGK